MCVLRSGGAVAVLRAVHHHAAGRTHIQLHADGDAAGQRGADRGVLLQPADRAAGSQRPGQASHAHCSQNAVSYSVFLQNIAVDHFMELHDE